MATTNTGCFGRKIKFATLYNDEASVRVYGAGASAAIAEREAKREVIELGWAWENYVTVEVTPEMAARIRDGEVEASELGIDLAPHRSDLGLA